MSSRHTPPPHDARSQDARSQDARNPRAARRLSPGPRYAPRRRARPARFALPALFALLGCLQACTGLGVDPDLPARVTLLDHQGARRFELVNEAHTSSVAYYSVPRTEASRKVVENDLLAALLDEMEDQGLKSYARAGRAPSGAAGRGSAGATGSASGRPAGVGATITRSIEVDSGGTVRQWTVGTGSDAEERLAFHRCSNTLLQVYNLAQSYQIIENDRGPAVFQQPQTGRP